MSLSQGKVFCISENSPWSIGKFEKKFIAYKRKCIYKFMKWLLQQNFCFLYISNYLLKNNQIFVKISGRFMKKEGYQDFETMHATSEGNSVEYFFKKNPKTLALFSFIWIYIGTRCPATAFQLIPRVQRPSTRNFSQVYQR